MPLEDALAVGAANAAVTGNVQDFGSELGYLVHKAEIDVATASGSTDIHVQLEHITAFYNTLSDLHGQLLAQIEGVTGEASALHSLQAGGSVPGARRAWDAMAQASGGLPSNNSLVANLQVIDGKVLEYMAALQHNAQQYARNENLAIATLGRAATSETAPASRTSTPLPGSEIPNDSSGIGGK